MSSPALCSSCASGDHQWHTGRELLGEGSCANCACDWRQTTAGLTTMVARASPTEIVELIQDLHAKGQRLELELTNAKVDNLHLVKKNQELVDQRAQTRDRIVGLLMNEGWEEGPIEDFLKLAIGGSR